MQFGESLQQAALHGLREDGAEPLPADARSSPSRLACHAPLRSPRAHRCRRTRALRSSRASRASRAVQTALWLFEVARTESLAQSNAKAALGSGPGGGAGTERAKSQGVSGASQRRYVHYYHALLQPAAAAVAPPEPATAREDAVCRPAMLSRAEALLALKAPPSRVLCDPPFPPPIPVILALA